MYLFCPFCGTKDAAEKMSPNEGGEFFVAEQFDCATECFDAEIVWYVCSTCTECFYAKEYHG